MKKMKQVQLDTLNRGAVMDLFDLEFGKVLQNIEDENTKPDEVRSVTITLKIKPDKTRRTAETKLSVTSKLSSVKPSESFMFFDKSEKGFEAFEDEPTPELNFVEKITSTGGK